MAATPFIVGIDLGTTNSAVSFVDTRQSGGVLEVLAIPQLTAPSLVEARAVLPSFLFFPESHEIDSGAVALPWNRSPDVVAGVLARDRGALTPARVVTSAKSWLVHRGVDRQAPILPWGATSGPRISPVTASAHLLSHIRDAWNATIAGSDERLWLERQRLVLTVPASFDEEARELTVEAARLAQLADVRLLEEPIAAFYAWMAEQRASPAVEGHRLALVCDVGGGTTDFSLIRVATHAGTPEFERVAIGEHLLLGGDNVDLALAALVEQRLTESRPDLRLAITQRAALRHSCGAAKERLLGDASPDRVTVTVLGAGRSVVAGTMTVDLVRDDVQRTLNDFLPPTNPGDVAVATDRRAGLRELALPYETDPAITRHLAAFLIRAAAAAGEETARIDVAGRAMARPDLVLFNGGFFTPAVARARVVDALAAWFGEAPQVLATHRLDAAVALGAATYGRLRAGIGPALSLVKAGSARVYYIGLRAPRVDEAVTAVCVLARGTDEGTESRLDHLFTVAANRPISFALYSSTVRTDQTGEIVSLRPGHDAHEHAPLVTVLRYGRKSRQLELPVRLALAFTEVGTLELWCESQVSDHRWRLQFQLRTSDPMRQEPVDETQAAIISDEAMETAEREIRALFQGDASGPTAENILARLEQITGYAKSEWPLPILRRFADVLIEVADARRRSAALEARWLNLFGFCVRPGLGAAKDPWRIAEARRVYAAGLVFPNAIQNRVEWLVLWQRAAGGFSTGQQRDLAQQMMGDLGIAGKKGRRINRQMERESWRLLASLERVDASTRRRAGDAVIAALRRDRDNASLLWSIGRLGARVPLYGPLSSVVPPEEAARWIEALMAFDDVTPDLASAAVQIAARTDDPLRDLEAGVRERLRDHLLAAGVNADALRPLDELVAISVADSSRVFGEPLPAGLRLEAS